MKNPSHLKNRDNSQPTFKSLDEIKNFLKVYVNEDLNLNSKDWSQNPTTPIYSYELSFYMKKISIAKIFIPWSKKWKINVFDYKGNMKTLWKIILSDELLRRNNESKIEELTKSLFNAYNWDLIISDANNLVFNENLWILSQTPKSKEVVEWIVSWEYVNNYNTIILIINIPQTEKYLLFQIKHNWNPLKINYSNNKTSDELETILSK